jgi:ribosomal protein S18 acetylase RimI-like enzyme
MPPAITFRPIEEGDQEFLARLYASTRQDEMAMLDWPQEEKDAFLRQQFDAQHRYYQEVFVGAAFDLILLDGKPAGRLYVDRRDDEIRLIDIALLTEHRRRGVGRILMEQVLAEGQKAGKPVRIHVERNNPALRLYDRLGFERVEDQGVYFLMEWRPRMPGE